MPAAEVGQAQGDQVRAVRTGHPAALDIQGEGRAIGANAVPVPLGGGEDAVRLIVMRGRSRVEGRHQAVEGAALNRVRIDAEQLGRGGVHPVDRPVEMQGDDRHGGQDGVQQGVLGRQLVRHEVSAVLQSAQGQADLGHAPGHGGEQQGVRCGVAETFARHQRKVERDRKDNGQGHGRAPGQQGGGDHGRQHRQIVEAAQPLEQGSRRHGHANSDHRQQQSAPASARRPRDGVQHVFHRRMNGVFLSDCWNLRPARSADGVLQNRATAGLL
ncbi:hypothetical protein D3C80_1064410 [compost metagenome]